MKKLNVGIVGATGYTGVELIKLLVNHPQVHLQYLTSTSYIGKNINEIYPHLLPFISQTLVDFDPKDKALAALDLLFLALPHGHAMEAVKQIKGPVIIDLGSDFRFQDHTVYEKAYQPHTAVELNKTAVYGLPEINRQQIAGKKLIANPGCYVTAATLALKPIIDKLAYVPGSIIIDAKSGVSGAGRGKTYFSDAHDNFSAYKVEGHRHQPEIEQNLGTKVTFVPHLLPIDRGILATCYITLKEKTTRDNLYMLYDFVYESEPFVHMVKHAPTIKDVVGSNMCHIGLFYREEMDQVIVVSVIDNLLKGASGQAVQNMNVVFGFPEMMGLNIVPLNP